MLSHNALSQLKTLEGTNLFDLVPDPSQIGKNKGWVGQTLENFLGLTAGNSQGMDGEDFELKSTTLLPRDGGWVPKETIKITQLNPKTMLSETFETSALWKKFSRLVFVGVHHESDALCRAVKIAAINVADPLLVSEMRTFWNEVQELVLRGELKDYVNFGTSEGYLQLRPTGDGKYFSTCPITGEKFPARAFYATKKLISSLF